MRRLTTLLSTQRLVMDLPGPSSDVEYRPKNPPNSQAYALYLRSTEHWSHRWRKGSQMSVSRECAAGSCQGEMLPF